MKNRLYGNFTVNCLFLQFLLLMWLISSQAFSQQNGQKDLLTTNYPKDKLNEILLSKDDWKPFPTIQERESWEGLSEAQKSEILENGEKALQYEWPSLKATMFLEFARIGNRSNFQNVRSERRNMVADLLLAELVENKGRFTDQLVNGIWLICEESYWGVPAHLYLQKDGPGLPNVEEPTVDLFAAQTANLLAWTDYLLNEKLDEVSPLIRPRIFKETDERILTPNLERDDFWWMGFSDRIVNNWNPWINSNWLSAALLLERDEERRKKAVNKIILSLDKFLNPYPADGGCDEGPSYWGHAGGSLFDCLELLYSATDGKFDVYENQLVKNIGTYLYKVYIDKDYFVNFADAAAKVTISSDLVYRYGKRINDDNLKAFGAYMAKNQQKEKSERGIDRKLFALFNAEEIEAAEASLPNVRDSYFEDLQVMTARSVSGSSKSLYLAAKGGHNAESHNHNDIGNFIVYVKGNPAIIDAGSGTYTRKTFSSQRYELWNNQSGYHNLPTVNGVMQQAGREFKAENVKYKGTNSYAQFSLNIEDAYPEEAGITSWKRTIRLTRGKNIALVDKFKLTQATKDISMNFLTPCEVILAESGEIRLRYKGENAKESFTLYINYDPASFQPEVQEIVLDQPEDGRIKSVWGESLKRVQLISKKSVSSGTWKILMSSY
ncbi:heparinase II/III domain-containing protein [Flexithrix dorotheae]|uniref:heparinase II/III domain-containing protein n=1 Tax=Flexithrix dorotheae TaxID=70993 RepID=UPI000A00484F|nr:heparinase II/III family protein [Flexithrix dorotheae]